MRRLLLACALVACGGDDDPGPRGDATARITHYDYRFDVDSRAAHAQVTAVVETPGNCLALPFRAEGGDLATARIDGAPTIDGSALDGATLKLCGERGHDA